MNKAASGGRRTCRSDVRSPLSVRRQQLPRYWTKEYVKEGLRLQTDKEYQELYQELEIAIKENHLDGLKLNTKSSKSILQPSIERISAKYQHQPPAIQSADVEWLPRCIWEMARRCAANARRRAQHSPRIRVGMPSASVTNLPPTKTVSTASEPDTSASSPQSFQPSDTACPVREGDIRAATITISREGQNHDVARAVVCIGKDIIGTRGSMEDGVRCLDFRRFQTRIKDRLAYNERQDYISWMIDNQMECEVEDQYDWWAALERQRQENRSYISFVVRQRNGTDCVRGAGLQIVSTRKRKGASSHTLRRVT